MVWFGGTETVQWDSAKRKNTTESYNKYLKLFPNGVHTTEARSSLNALAGESVCWDSIKHEGKITDYEAYLKKYPGGTFANQANLLIENIIWDSTSQRNNIDSYELYLKKYPKGSHINEAREAIENLNSGWDRILRENNISSYQTYLNSFPNGFHTIEAKILMKRLTNPYMADMLILLVEHQKLDWEKACKLVSKVPEDSLKKYAHLLLDPPGTSWIMAAKSISLIESDYEDILKDEWKFRGGATLCDKRGCWNYAKYEYYTNYLPDGVRCEEHKKWWR